MLNAVEPGTVVAIHRRVAKDECFVVLRGKVGVTTHDDDGAVIGDVVLSRESGGYGVDIPKGVWHKVVALEGDIGDGSFWYCFPDLVDSVL